MRDIQAVELDSVSCSSGSLPDVFWPTLLASLAALIVRTGSYTLPPVVRWAASWHAEGDGLKYQGELTEAEQDSSLAIISRNYSSMLSGASFPHLSWKVKMLLWAILQLFCGFAMKYFSSFIHGCNPGQLYLSAKWKRAKWHGSLCWWSYKKYNIQKVNLEFLRHTTACYFEVISCSRLWR